MRTVLAGKPTYKIRFFSSILPHTCPEYWLLLTGSGSILLLFGYYNIKLQIEIENRKLAREVLVLLYTIFPGVC